MALEASNFNSAESVSGALSKMTPVAASSHGKKGRDGAQRLSQVQGQDEVSTIMTHHLPPEQLTSSYHCKGLFPT